MRQKNFSEVGENSVVKNHTDDPSHPQPAWAKAGCLMIGRHADPEDPLRTGSQVRKLGLVVSLRSAASLGQHAKALKFMLVSFARQLLICIRCCEAEMHCLGMEYSRCFPPFQDDPSNMVTRH